MLISDARAIFFRTAAAEAGQNPLVAAFCGWLSLREDFVLLLNNVAQNAASASGAQRSSRNVAVLGFACGVETLKARFAEDFLRQLTWSIGKPNFSGDGEPSGVITDPLNFAGIVAGAENVLNEPMRCQFVLWARDVCKDARTFIHEGDWRRRLIEIIGLRYSVAGLVPNDDRESWIVAGLHKCGWGDVSMIRVDDVLKSTLKRASETIDGFEAALRCAATEWAVERAMDFDIAAPTIPDIAKVLDRVSTSFQRWTWEDAPRTSRRGAEARRWHIDNEYHFQSLLYAVLKPLIPSLEEELYLPPTGTYQPRADLCILALKLVIEVKFWYRSKSVKELTEEIAADLTLYLRNDSPYQTVIVAIWDDGARTEEHAELRRGLKGLGGLREVILVNRPSRMNGAAAEPTATTKTRKKS